MGSSFPARIARRRETSLKPFGMLVSWVFVGTGVATGCKPVQSSETFVANTQLGYVSRSCGEDAPYFIANKNMCQDPDLRFTIAAVKAPAAVPPTGAALAAGAAVPLLALSTPGLPSPLVHLEIGFQLRDKDGFEKLLRQFGTDPLDTAFAGYTHHDNSFRRGLGGQYYRVTDLLGPGFQALAGQLWSGPTLAGSFAGVYAALSATPTTLEFPRFDAATYFSLVKPRSSVNGGLSISFVKAFQESQLVPLQRPPVDGSNALFQRSRQDESAMVERNRGLLPGDILLVVRRKGGETTQASNARPAPTATPSPQAGGAVKAILARSPAEQEQSCLASGDLVHTAVLVEKDAWFESLQTLQGALFRIAPFDDVVLHAQHLAKEASLGRLCFAVVRRDRIEIKANDGTSQLKGVTALTLSSLLPASQLPASSKGLATASASGSAPTRLSLGALLAAQGASPPLATKYEDMLVGRVQVLPVAPGQPPLPLTALSR